MTDLIHPLAAEATAASTTVVAVVDEHRLGSGEGRTRGVFGECVSRFERRHARLLLAYDPRPPARPSHTRPQRSVTMPRAITRRGTPPWVRLSRTRVAALVALAFLFCAGFSLAAVSPTVSISGSSIGASTASFSYAANQTASFSCALDTLTNLQACGADNTTGSAVYSVSPGTHTFVVVAQMGTTPAISAIGRASASATQQFDVAPAATATTTTTRFLPAPPTTVIHTTTINKTQTVTHRITSTKISQSHQQSWSGWAAGSGGALLAVLTLAFSASRLKRGRLRAGWQLDAKQADPPSHCIPPGHYTKTETTLKPARRRITSMNLHGQNGGRATATRDTVDALNHAVAQQRQQQPQEEIRLTLLPIANTLLETAETSLPEGAVTIDAHLGGGTIEARFTRYHCLNGAWAETDTWTVEGEDQRDLAAAQLTLPRNPKSIEQLAAQLVSFLASIDIHQPEPTPEALPLTHS